MTTWFSYFPWPIGYVLRPMPPGQRLEDWSSSPDWSVPANIDRPVCFRFIFTAFDLCPASQGENHFGVFRIEFSRLRFSQLRSSGILVKLHLAGRKILHAPHPHDLSPVEHVEQNRAALTNFLHYQPHVCFRNGVNELIVFGISRLDAGRN